VFDRDWSNRSPESESLCEHSGSPCYGVDAQFVNVPVLDPSEQRRSGCLWIVGVICLKCGTSTTCVRRLAVEDTTPTLPAASVTVVVLPEYVVSRSLLGCAPQGLAEG